MAHYSYPTQFVCASKIDFDLEGNVVTNISFTGGCNGNLQGISKLVQGMKYEDVIARLNNISCNGKPTSCPDQLCRAIEQLMQSE